MKYYEELLKLEVFTVGDLEKITKNRETARSVIKRFMSKKYVRKVRKNLYYCVNIENKESAADRYVIASHINEKAYISHHSALEYYGLEGQIFYDMYVSSEKYFNKFEFEGITYNYVKSNVSEGIITPGSNSKIRVTDLERTVVDCIKDIDLAGGTEELLNCFNLVTNLDNGKLYKYLEAYSQQFLYQKAGFIFEVFRDNFNIDKNLLTECQSKVKDKIRYFDNDVKDYGGTYFRKWQLIVPKSIEQFFVQGVNELV